MQSTHRFNLAKLENVFEVSIEKAENEKRNLEGEFAKWLKFQTATTKVDGLPEGSFDNVILLIETISFEIESKSDFIGYLRADLKETIIDYFEKHLKNVELCQELKDLAAMYDIVPSGKASNVDRSSQHVTGLMEIQGWFEEDRKKFEQFSQELTVSKQQLLNYRQNMVVADSPSLSEHIKQVDQDIFDVVASLDLVEQQLARLKELIKSDMIMYSKKFISQSDINRSILEIWQQYGIKYCDLVNDSTVIAPESTSTEMANSTSQITVQPEPAVIESMPVVKTVPDSEENEIVSGSLEEMHVVEEQLANGIVNQSIELVACTEDGECLENEECIDTEYLTQHFSEENDQIVEINQSTLSSIYFAETLYTCVISTDSNSKGVKVTDVERDGENQCLKNEKTIDNKQLAQHFPHENWQMVKFDQSTMSSIYSAGTLKTFVIPTESHDNGDGINDEKVGEETECRAEIKDEFNNQA